MTDINEDYMPDLVSLTDDDGVEYEFEILQTMENEGKNYVAMVPFSEDDNNAEDEDTSLVVLRVSEEDGEVFYEIIEDDDEYNMIVDAFSDSLSQFFEIKSDDDE